MFGYIVPVTNELKVSDFEIFKSYYCGLCVSIKNKFGNIPRLGLNYDSTFFAVLFDGVNSDKTTINENLCLRHPLNKKNHIIKNSSLEYATDLNITLIYFKILDDIEDEKNIKSISLNKIIKPYYDKISNIKLKETFQSNLNTLHKLEKNNTLDSIDEISHPFSNLLGEVFRDCPFVINNDSKETRNLLYDFGYSFAKWIYLVDALEDLNEDMNKNRFNPIEKIYNKNSLEYKDLIKEIKEPMDFFLMTLASNCSAILKKLPIKRNKDIIDNIVNLGLIQKYMNIFANL